MMFKRINFLSILFFISILLFAIIYGYKNSVKHINIDKFNVLERSSEQIVVSYLKNNGKLPDYYIKKKVAIEKGWLPEKGNLCKIFPGKVIGGDVFRNREKSVPDKKGRVWYEGDLNYNCGNRGKDRVIFSNDGLIFVTYNHYKTFQKR